MPGIPERLTVLGSTFGSRHRVGCTEDDLYDIEYADAYEDYIHACRTEPLFYANIKVTKILFQDINHWPSP